MSQVWKNVLAKWRLYGVVCPLILALNLASAANAAVEITFNQSTGELHIEVLDTSSHIIDVRESGSYVDVFIDNVSKKIYDYDYPTVDIGVLQADVEVVEAIGGVGDDEIYLDFVDPNSGWTSLNYCIVYGEDGDDLIQGSYGSDILSGGDGDDSIFNDESNVGSGVQDLIYGDAGMDEADDDDQDSYFSVETVN